MDTMMAGCRHEGTGEGCRTVLQLRDGSCIAVTRGLVRYARDVAALDDPLGNGVRGAITIPPAQAPAWQGDGAGFLAEVAGGALLLAGGAVVLVKPWSIELYGSGPDALHGRACLGRIELGDGRGG